MDPALGCFSCCNDATVDCHWIVCPMAIFCLISEMPFKEDGAGEMVQSVKCLLCKHEDP